MPAAYYPSYSLFLNHKDKETGGNILILGKESTLLTL